MSGTEAAPGTSIGLPPEGRGSLASWGKRIGALIIDWGASMVLASAIVGPTVIRGGGWKMWMPMAVFFVESVLFTAMAGGSFGQIVARVAVVRLDGLGPIGWWRAAARTAMKFWLGGPRARKLRYVGSSSTTRRWRCDNRPMRWYWPSSTHVRPGTGGSSELVSSTPWNAMTASRW